MSIFGSDKKARQHRTMMIATKQAYAHIFKCWKCRYETPDFVVMSSLSKVKAGIPCPKCNASLASAEGGSNE
jgi:DNA-directed RNA polymerase subunit RPC12/RpoP